MKRQRPQAEGHVPAPAAKGNPAPRSADELIRQHGGNTQGRVAWITTIPQHADVDRMLDAGVPRSEIARWLREDCGYGAKASLGRVSGYAQRRNEK